MNEWDINNHSHFIEIIGVLVIHSLIYSFIHAIIYSFIPSIKNAYVMAVVKTNLFEDHSKIANRPHTDWGG